MNLEAAAQYIALQLGVNNEIEAGESSSDAFNVARGFVAALADGDTLYQLDRARLGILRLEAQRSGCPGLWPTGDHLIEAGILVQTYPDKVAPVRCSSSSPESQQRCDLKVGHHAAHTHRETAYSSVSWARNADVQTYLGAER